MDHKQAIEILLQIENSFDTRSLMHRGIHFWPFIRLEIWTHLMRSMMNSVSARAGVSNPTMPGISASMPTENLSDEPERIAPVTPELPFLFSNEADIGELDLPLDFMFLGRLEDYSERAKEGQYNRVIDPLYSFARRSFKCVKVEPYSNDHVAFRHSLPSLYAAFEELRKRVPKNSREPINGFEQVLEQVRRVVPDIEITENWLWRRIDYCLTMAAAIRYVFERLRPKAVFFSCHYSPFNMAVTMACRLLGIVAVDIQHGRRGEFNGPDTHLSAIPKTGYEMLPDVFWCWDQASSGAIDNNTPESAGKPITVVGGNLWADLWKNGEGIQLADDSREFLQNLMGKRVILVTFQPDPHPLTSDLIEAMRMSPADWIWLLRTHPLRRAQSSVISQTLLAQSLTNFDIEFASKLPLFALLARADHHVTKWSSTALEALEFGVPTTLIDPVGARVYQEQIRARVFSFSENGKELLEFAQSSQNLATRIFAHETAGPTVAELADGALRKVLNSHKAQK